MCSNGFLYGFVWQFVWQFVLSTFVSVDDVPCASSFRMTFFIGISRCACGMCHIPGSQKIGQLRHEKYVYSFTSWLMDVNGLRYFS